ncbi:Small subunit (SSU) processome component [Tulasnella sp. 419]|nr:Small subunit (SSU) processome component [Tulasnella sp. 419]
MDSLISAGNSIAPVGKKPRNHHKQRRKESQSDHPDATLQSIISRTKLSTAPSAHPHIKNPKLRSHLSRITQRAKDAKEQIEDAQLLMTEEKGRIVTEGELEKTWKVTQGEIVDSIGVEQAKGRREWKLDGGTYKARYTRNGRHLAIAGKLGHVASFDWQTGKMHAELQLQETLRDITYLHDHSHFAVAQKKYVYIYDQSGLEIHRLSSHIEVQRMEFLPFHWLLVTIGNAGYLKYQDTSTGQLVSQHRTKLGSSRAMCQNLHNAVIYLGHQNGTITLHTPNLSTPAVTQLSHLGPVVSVSVDPNSQGRYMASAGADGRVKIWDCRNWKGCVREWMTRGTGDPELEWSQKGYLGVTTGSSVNVYSPPTITSPHTGIPPLYLTHLIPHRPLTSLRFCPYADVLTTGHSKGLSSILVPGSGEPNFDSNEADPFESKKARREREIRSLLDKIQPDMIALSPDFIGTIAEPVKPHHPPQDVPFSRLPRIERLKISGKADLAEENEATDSEEEEDEEKAASGSESSEEEDANDKPSEKRPIRTKKEKKKMRGRGKSLARYLRKKRKNVVDPST